LLAKNQDFKVLLQMGESTDGDEVENGSENVLDDEPTHLILCSSCERWFILTGDQLEMGNTDFPE